MERRLKHRLLIGGVALVVAVSAGGAYAATQSGISSRQTFINDVAKRLNVSPTQLRAAVRGALLDRLDAAVKAGKLTPAQANRLRQRIEQGAPVPFDPPLWRFGRPGPGLARHSLLPAAAAYLGLSQQQLLLDLGSGKTLAQVAQAHGKSVAGLRQALASAFTARLNRLVASGQLTKAQEQKRLNRLNARIDRLVNHARLERHGAADGPPGGPGWGPPSERPQGPPSELPQGPGSELPQGPGTGAPPNGGPMSAPSGGGAPGWPPPAA